MKRCSHNESLMAEVTSASKRLQPGLRAVGPDVMEATKIRYSRHVWEPSRDDAIFNRVPQKCAKCGCERFGLAAGFYGGDDFSYRFANGIWHTGYYAPKCVERNGSRDRIVVKKV